MARSHSRAWLASALITSVLIVTAAPWLGQLRRDRPGAAGEWFAPVVAVAVAGAVMAAWSAIAAVRIRSHRRRRYAALGAAVVMAFGYGAAMRTGIPEVDAVESVHFLEYGLLTTLFYWRGGRRAIWRWWCCRPGGLVVGIADEWLQWFVPARVGEVRDVVLNLGAIVSGLLFAMAIAPPPRLPVTLSAESRRRVRWLGDGRRRRARRLPARRAPGP